MKGKFINIDDAVSSPDDQFCVLMSFFFQTKFSPTL